MPSRTARLSKKGCGFATPECRAQRDVAVHPGPAPPPPLLAAPRLSTTALGYLEIRWVVSGGFFDRDIQSRIVFHAACLPLRFEAAASLCPQPGAPHLQGIGRRQQQAEYPI